MHFSYIDIYSILDPDKLLKKDAALIKEIDLNNFSFPESKICSYLKSRMPNGILVLKHKRNFKFSFDNSINTIGFKCFDNAGLYYDNQILIPSKKEVELISSFVGLNDKDFIESVRKMIVGYKTIGILY